MDILKIVKSHLIDCAPKCVKDQAEEIVAAWVRTLPACSVSASDPAVAVAAATILHASIETFAKGLLKGEVLN